jgi:hypothetical protein
MAALPALKPKSKSQPKAHVTTFAAWLSDELRDRTCEDAPEFARRYGFAESTVRAWLTGHRVPGITMCREIAEVLDLTVVEVVCAAGHLFWSEIDAFTAAYGRLDMPEYGLLSGD